MTLQRLLSLTRKAVDTFNLIESGDKIAVGISGGKDSLTLLYALNGLKRFYPNSFTIEAITVDLGLPGFDLIQIKALCSELNVPYTIVQTEIAQIIFNERKEPNPCSLCAKMRKGALNDAAKKRAVIKLLMPIIKMMLSKQCYYLCFLRGVFTHFLRKPILTEQILL